MEAKGFVGYSAALFKENFKPAFQWDPNSNTTQTFMTIFGVFFPSVTGILAGTSITGDLRDPSGAIPKGNFHKWSQHSRTCCYNFTNESLVSYSTLHSFVINRRDICHFSTVFVVQDSSEKDEKWQIQCFEYFFGR